MNMDLKDGLSVSDTVDRKPKSLYHTEVVATNELGEVLFEKSNVILIGGRRFTLEKLFNITVTPRKTLNSLLNLESATVEGQEDSNTLSKVGPNKKSAICLFGVGNGGSDMHIGSVANPVAGDPNLFNILPMRYVENAVDLTTPNSKYFMHREENGMHAFYLKRFEQKPEIKLIIDGKIVESSSDIGMSEPNYGNYAESYDIQDATEAYVEIKLKIGVDDIREYYEYIGEEHPRINELGLYFGYNDNSGDGYDSAEPWSDYKEVEAFSKLTFNNESLADATKEINVVYRIYI